MYIFNFYHIHIFIMPQKSTMCLLSVFLLGYFQKNIFFYHIWLMVLYFAENLQYYNIFISHDTLAKRKYFLTTDESFVVLY